MSRTMARDRIMPDAPPMACTPRATMSISMDVASAHATLAATNSAMPAIRVGRRP
jgi:hypothetical protein